MIFKTLSRVNLFNFFPQVGAVFGCFVTSLGPQRAGSLPGMCEHILRNEFVSSRDSRRQACRVVFFCSFSAVFVREAIALREFFMEDACVRGRLCLHKHPTNVFDLVLFKLCGSAGQNSIL